MGGFDEQRGLFLVITMVTLVCTHHCFAAAVNGEGLVEMATSPLFPDGSSGARFLGALLADATCGRRDSSKCTPPPNRPPPPPSCNGGSFNRNCPKWRNSWFSGQSLSLRRPCVYLLLLFVLLRRSLSYFRLIKILMFWKLICGFADCYNLNKYPNLLFIVPLWCWTRLPILIENSKNMYVNRDIGFRQCALFLFHPFSPSLIQLFSPLPHPCFQHQTPFAPCSQWLEFWSKNRGGRKVRRLNLGLQGRGKEVVSGKKNETWQRKRKLIGGKFWLSRSSIL